MKFVFALITLLSAIPVAAQPAIPWEPRKQMMLYPRRDVWSVGDSLLIQAYARTSTGVAVTSPYIVFGLTDTSLFTFRRTARNAVMVTSKKVGTGAKLQAVWTTSNGVFRDSVIMQVSSPVIVVHSRCWRMPSGDATWIEVAPSIDQPAGVRVTREMVPGGVITVERPDPMRGHPYCVGLAQRNAGSWRVFSSSNNHPDGYCITANSAGWTIKDDFADSAAAVFTLMNMQLPLVPPNTTTCIY